MLPALAGRQPARAARGVPVEPDRLGRTVADRPAPTLAPLNLRLHLPPVRHAHPPRGPPTAGQVLVHQPPAPSGSRRGPRRLACNSALTADIRSRRARVGRQRTTSISTRPPARPGVAAGTGPGRSAAPARTAAGRTTGSGIAWTRSGRSGSTDVGAESGGGDAGAQTAHRPPSPTRPLPLRMPQVCKGVNAPIAARGRRPRGTADRGERMGRIRGKSELCTAGATATTVGREGVRRPMIWVRAGQFLTFGSTFVQPHVKCRYR